MLSSFYVKPPQILFFFTLICATLAGSFAIAETRLVALGHALIISAPLPDFAGLGKPETEGRSGTAVAGHRITIEGMIPKGEEFKNWSTLYAIKLEEGLDVSFENYVAQLLDVFLSACDLDPANIGRIELMPEHLRLIIPCQSYNSDPSIGELAVFDIQKRDDDFINLYQHWRGGAFDATDVSSWPEATTAGIARFMMNADTLEILEN